MRPLYEFKNSKMKYLFTDIDDTLTEDGQLPAESYAALWRLSEAGVKIIPVTGRPAGWCDMIARFWPVEAVIGENGAFYFSYQNKKMKRVWAYDEATRAGLQQKLSAIKKEVLTKVPGAAVSADQFARLFDLAIDFCEDISALTPQDVDRIVAIFKAHGAQAKVSSIHVNGWFGSHDKLSMCKKFCLDELKFDIEKKQEMVGFVGDSPNDEPMFAFFENSFGVANVLDFQDRLTHKPHFICSAKAATGFVELADHLLKK